MMNCSAVAKVRSQFFQSLRCFSSHAKRLSTTHRFGITLKVYISLRLATDTSIWSPIKSFYSIIKRYSILEKLQAKYAVGSRFSTDTVWRKITSDKSTFLGAVFLRPLSNIERSCSNCSFVMSLGYFFFILFYSIFLRV